jgi:serine/threonine protein kinase
MYKAPPINEALPHGARKKPMDLSQLLSSTPASPTTIMPVFHDVIAALESLRGTSREPRSLDPRKIRFRSGGGIQVFTSGADRSELTVVFSSSKYSAPEVFDEIKGPDDCHTRNCYVLGFIFYELLLGRDFFEQQFLEVCKHGELGWLSWHCDKTKLAKPLGEILKGFPYVFSQLIEGLMAKEPSQRTTDLKKISDSITDSIEATRTYAHLRGQEVDKEPLLRERAYGTIKDVKRWTRFPSCNRLWNALWNRVFPIGNQSHAWLLFKSGVLLSFLRESFADSMRRCALMIDTNKKESELKQ